MIKFDTYVNASTIWPTAKDHEYKGVQKGLCTGWNIEVTSWKGQTYWMDTTFTWLSPEQYFNDDFHTWMYEEDGLTPTGRICFRGYFIEEYDFDERDYYYVKCDADGNIIEEG